MWHRSDKNYEQICSKKAHGIRLCCILMCKHRWNDLVVLPTEYNLEKSEGAGQWLNSKVSCFLCLWAQKRCKGKYGNSSEQICLQENFTCDFQFSYLHCRCKIKSSKALKSFHYKWLLLLLPFKRCFFLFQVAIQTLTYASGFFKLYVSVNAVIRYKSLLKADVCKCLKKSNIGAIWELCIKILQWFAALEEKNSMLPAVLEDPQVFSVLLMGLVTLNEIPLKLTSWLMIKFS